MINNIDQLKSLILWCKEHKVKNLDLGNVKFEISELDFIPEETSNLINLNSSNTGKYNTDTLIDTLDENNNVEDEDLFWSTDK